jgi:hypothetical protein
MANDVRLLCLLDCSAIQRYVFGSNMLKSNVGASHVVTQIYDAWIPKALKEVFPAEKNIEKRYEEWKEKKKQAIIQLDSDHRRQWETGYVGGGNALMMFRREEDAKKFIRAWTRMLLKEAPGVRPAVALLPTTSQDLKNNSEKIFEDLFTMLEENKSRYIAETTLPRHGFTAECKLTGLAAELPHKFPDETVKEISSVSKTKLDNFDDANKAIVARFKDPLGDDYVFAKDNQEMGQTENVENHVAIVHIDGNAVGEMFKNCETIAQKRKLSLEVDQATTEAMRETLRRLVEKYDLLIEKEVLDKKKLNGDGKPRGLPLRPIILNGDDVTFICDSRLAFFLAETFINAFAEEEVNIGKEKKKLSSCAGIAVIKTKYPFYRGYMLAEALCSNAKKKYREYKPQGKTSWLDFHISHRGLPSNLGDMREDQYRVGNASLLWRPWQITAQKEWSAFNQLKEAIRYFKPPPDKAEERPRWPKRKLQDLEETLALGKKRTEEFITMMEARKLKLPPIADFPKIQSEGWEIVENELKTPYYDILEAMEFYPDCLL